MQDEYQTSFRERLYMLFNVREHEVTTVYWLSLFSFFQGLGSAFLFSAAYIFFVAKAEISSIFWVYIGTGASLLAFDLLQDRLEKAFSIGRLVLINLSILVITILVFRFLLNSASNSAAILFGLLILEKVVQITANSEFARVNAVLFDVRQSKRLFGLLGSPELLARIIGLLAVPLLIKFIPLEEVLSCSAFCFAVSILTFSIILRRHRTLLARAFSGIEVSKEKAVSTFDYLQTTIFGGRFTWLVSVLVFLLVNSFIIVEYVFLAEVSTKYINQAQLAFFFGIFFSIDPFIALFSKSFLSARLLVWKGIRTVLSILPYGLAGLAMLILFAKGIDVPVDLWLIGFLMLFTGTTKNSITDPAFLSLFQALQENVKFQALKIAGGAENLSYVLAGGILLGVLGAAAGTGVPSHVLFILILLMVAMTTLWIVKLIYQEYSSMLDKALTKRSIGLIPINLEDGNSRVIICEKLLSSDVNDVLYTIDILKKASPKLLMEHLTFLLNHRSANVKLETLAFIEEQKYGPAIPAIRMIIDAQKDDVVRAAALGCFCKVSEDDIFPYVSGFLDSPNASVQRAAMSGLLAYGGITGIIHAGGRLLDMIASEDPEARGNAADIIGAVGLPNFYLNLTGMISDRSIDVRKRAILAAAKVRNPKLVPLLVPPLSSAKLMTHARAAIAKIGPQAVPYLIAEFDNPQIEQNIKRRICEILGRIGGSAAMHFMFKNIQIDKYAVRNQLFYSLIDCGYKAEGKDALLAEELIEKEIRQAIFLLECIAQWSSAPSLFTKAMHMEVRKTTERIVILLSFLFDPVTMRNVRYNLFQGTSGQRANAIELLDVILSSSLKSKIFPLIEDTGIHQKILTLRVLYATRKYRLKESLALIIQPDYSYVDNWTKITALYELRALENKLGAEFYLPANQSRHWGESHRLELNYHYLESKVKADSIVISYDDVTNDNMNTTTNRLLLIEKVLLLKAVSIFRNTPEEILAEVASVLQEIEMQAGETVFDQGSEGSCMYIIYEGNVKVHQKNNVLAELGPKDFFGELSLLSPEPRSASVTTLTDVLLVKLDYLTFYEVVTDRVEVVRGIMEVLAERLKRQNTIISELKQGTKPLDAHLARVGDNS